MKSDDEILKELEQAAEGLLVVSESDHPFEIVRWDGKMAITPEYLYRISGKPTGSTIEETDLETFFQMSGIFRNVAGLLRENLSGTKVYKIGAITIPVYIIGRSPQGNWLGLSTRLVQT